MVGSESDTWTDVLISVTEPDRGSLTFAFERLLETESHKDYPRWIAYIVTIWKNQRMKHQSCYLSQEKQEGKIFAYL